MAAIWDEGESSSDPCLDGSVLGMGQQLRPSFLKVKNSTSCTSLLVTPAEGFCNVPIWSCSLQGVLAIVRSRAFADRLSASWNLQLCILPSICNSVLFYPRCCGCTLQILCWNVLFLLFCCCSHGLATLTLCCDGHLQKVTATNLRVLPAFPIFPCLWLLWFILGSPFYVRTKINNQVVCNSHTWARGALVSTASHKQGEPGGSLCD